MFSLKKSNEYKINKIIRKILDKIISLPYKLLRLYPINFLTLKIYNNFLNFQLNIF